MYFDFHLRSNKNIKEVLTESKRLGYYGVAVIQPSDIFDYNLIKDLSEIQSNLNLKLYNGVEITAKNGNDLKKKISRFRNKVDVLLVRGGKIKINRAACEDPRVDIVTYTHYKRRDCGLNHVIAKEAARNEVAVEINLNSILKARYSSRAKLLSQYRDILKLYRKYRFPLIISSGATSIFDLRKPLDIISLNQCFGITKDESIKGMSITPSNIIKRNEKRQDLVVAGVRNLGFID
ncbi:MAG: ribonuclease P protein component 3 [Methanomicrobiales archaeon]